MLGLVLINADKNKFKGGYLTLFKDIKKAKKDYKNINSMLKEFNIISSNMYNIIANNKDKFINNFNEIQKILHTHKDYQVIIDNIFHNFDYFLNNFELIKEWLLSDDFYQRYKKENHPYPSLLDPKKLNDKDEQINYHNIPAELAWEMNLPLPRKYRFIFITGGSCGHMAMFLYFKILKINRNWTAKTEIEKYKIAYNVFNTSKQYNIFSCQWDQMTKKLFYLVDANVPLVVLLRDPIERLKSIINHIVKYVDKIDLTCNPEDILTNKYYRMRDYPSIEKVNDIIDIPNYFDISQKIPYFKNITEIITLDVKDIIGYKCYITFYNLSKKLKFDSPNENLKEIFITPFVSKVMDMLPLTLVLCSMDQNTIENSIDGSTTKDQIKIVITFKKMMLYCNQEKLIDMKKVFFAEPFWDIQDEILFLINQNDKNELISNYHLFLKTQQYLKNFMIVFERKIKEEKKKLFNEYDILDYLKENKILRVKLKNVVESEIKFTKKINQKITNSWKYYQEFEKMCEELDGKEDSLKENISNN
ncbi:DUF2972 domain-containing protein [Campylobacter insulaenigrae]|uniref:DUF2972 domain-containing protein n=1 Tax=Campylobacter insulaenigrae TaxID=260714 RepID=UPI0021525195|nr:DUF2972 domain-containing protein [Campylobacter insulaenigrae]MCR6584442.1 DUF2972 domain-containing protein [Campylobacter insulaenigrae]